LLAKNSKLWYTICIGGAVNIAYKNMYCEKCGKTRDANQALCDCVSVAEVNGADKMAAERNYRILNAGMLALMAVLTLVSTITFFASMRDGGHHGIVGTYVLCMLLVAPSLKVFLDKVSCHVFKKLNLIGLVIIFLAILVQVTLSFLTIAWPI